MVSRILVYNDEHCSEFHEISKTSYEIQFVIRRLMREVYITKDRYIGCKRYMENKVTSALYRTCVARVRHESAVASSLAVLAGRERLQAGRCFSHVPFDCGQPFDGFSGRADGWGPERSGRDFIQWTRQYLCAEYTIIEHAVNFLLYSYKTVENTLHVLLRQIRSSRTS